MSAVYFCYSSTKNVEAWAEPGAIFIPDQHRDNPAFKAAQAKGAEVYPYLDVCEDKVRGDKDKEFVAFVGGSRPLWGNNRSSWFPLLDMRVGSQYVARAVDYIAKYVMPFFDGITLDVVGGQLHKRAGWADWPPAEKKAWQDGNLDFVRLLDIARRRIKPWFKIETINIWHEDKRGLAYVDGFCIELHEPTAFWRSVASVPCGYLGQRRVFAMAESVEDAKAFAQMPGVTHVTAVTGPNHYAVAMPPVVKPVDRRLPEALAMRQWLQQNRGIDEAELLRAQLGEAAETKELLANRVDVLTAKVRAMATFVAEQAEGVE